MKTIRINPAKRIRLIKGMDMAIGQMMELVDGCKKGGIILRTYDGLVQLDSPSNTWSGNNCTLEGRLLNSGEGITLIQE